ncbi:MAG: CBS domain-containing protein, partial [bacterium]
SISDNQLFSCLLNQDNIKSNKISSIMQSPFPVIAPNASVEEVSKLITKENSAVLVTDMGGNTHIITKYDIIDAIAG